MIARIRQLVTIGVMVMDLYDYLVLMVFWTVIHVGEIVAAVPFGIQMQLMSPNEQPIDCVGRVHLFHQILNGFVNVCSVLLFLVLMMIVVMMMILLWQSFCICL